MIYTDPGNTQCIRKGLAERIPHQQGSNQAGALGYGNSVELPGMNPEDVHVEFKDGHLWVTGERKQESEEKGKTYHRVERRYGSFRRVIAIGNEVDAEKVDATYKDGVLTVDIPKAAAAQPKRIQIKT